MCTIYGLYAASLRSTALLALSLCFSVMSAGTSSAVSNGIVISQIYAGSATTGSVYKSDFIELHNTSTSAVSLVGLSVQYASATGTGNFGSTSVYIVPLSGMLAPGGFYLIRAFTGSTGLDLPTPDATSNMNLSGTGGKVALVTTTTSLGCNGGSTPCSPVQTAYIIDLVGYGTANYFEGSAPAPAPGVATSVLRNGSGCTETDNNGSDFSIASPPEPHNSASPAVRCRYLLTVNLFGLYAIPSYVGAGTVTVTPPGTQYTISACFSHPPTCETSHQYYVEYERNIVVSLNAVAGSQSTFVGWSGDCSSEPCSLVMNSDKRADANFMLPLIAWNWPGFTAYYSFDEALAAAVAADTLNIAGATIYGDFVANKSLNLFGGWDPLNNGSYEMSTVLDGSLTVTDGDSISDWLNVKGELLVKGGSLKVRRMVVMQK